MRKAYAFRFLQNNKENYYQQYHLFPKPITIRFKRALKKIP